MDNSSSRRRFLQTLGLATGALAAGSFTNAQEVAPLAPKKITIPDPNNIGPMTTWPPRKPGAIYMGGFRAPKLDKVRVAFVGVGERGSMHVGQMAVIEGAEIVGICDLYEDWAKRSADVVEKKTGKRPPIFTKGPEDYKRMMKEVKPDAVIVSCTKGIEQGTHKRMTEILQEYLPSNPIGVLSGPNHAEDICLGLPSASLIGFEDPKYADWVQQIFASKTFRVYSATDIIGMQLGGTIKNVFAIGAGLCEGLNLGDNAQAALLTRGLAEMTRIGVASGGRRETFMGLSGVGDLIVTCYSRHSRNQTVGRRLAEGKSLQEILDTLGMVAEGVPNTLSVYEIARKLEVRTPLIDAVYSVLYESKPPMEALAELMTRDPRPELD